MRNRLFVALLACLVALPLCGAGRRRVERPAVITIEGAVTSVAATAISIRTPQGPTITFGVTPATEIELGMSDIALTALENGTYITARVEQAPGGSLTAIEVHVHATPPTAGSETVRVAGTVASVGAWTLQLKNERGAVTVNADASTVVRRSGEPIPFDAIRPGENAVVAGKITADATMFALAIEIMMEPPPPVPPLPTVYGEVTGLGESELLVTVNPPDPRMGMPTRLINVRVDAKTVIQKNGEQIHFSAIRVGDMVVAYGSFADEHTMIAAKIDVLDRRPPGELRGRVVEIKGNDLVVEPDGPRPMMVMPPLVVRVSEATEIWRDGAHASFRDIHPGDFIEAAGQWLDSSTLAAAKIAILAPPPFRVSGVVTAIGDRVIQIQAAGPGSETPAFVIRVNEKTEIFADGVAIEFGDIKVGDSLAAVGIQQADGAMLAQRIDVRRKPDTEWIAGIVKEVRGNDIVVAPGMPSPDGSAEAVIVRVDEKTTIVKNGVLATIGDVSNGDRLEAAGTWIERGVLLALKISVMEDQPPVISVMGRVTAVNGPDLTVEPYAGMMDSMPGNMTFVVRATAETVVTDHGMPARFAMILVGTYIHAFGKIEADRVVLATTIDIIDAPPPPVTFIEGSVVEVREREFVVAFPSFAYPSVTAIVRVGERTVITKGGAVIPLSDLKPADQVHATGTWAADGVFLAEKVAVRSDTPPPPPVTAIEGMVLAVREHELDVAFASPASSRRMVTVLVTEATVITKGGVRIRLAGIIPGDHVYAAGAFQGDGAFVAEKIAVNTAEPPPPVMASVSGLVAAIERSTLIVRETATSDRSVAVLTSPETKFVKNGNPSELSQARVGDMVRASGAWDAAGGLNARLVELMSPRM